MRKYLRQIAKARMKAMGMDRINRRMSVTGTGDNMKTPAWRRVIDGDMAGTAERALLGQGIRSTRKLRKVSA